MARKSSATNSDVAIYDFGRPNSEPQWAFFESRVKYTCYGGARGGGKSWAVTSKAAGGAYRWPGIHILIIRREYDEMENTLISPILKLLPKDTYKYNKNSKIIDFANGSQIKFGNMPGYGAAVQGKYQGQSYDWLFMDEATNFTEEEFRGLAACVRGVNDIPKRIYLTCNPGGIGHNWVKRLFIDRKFRAGEDPEEYLFIKATVDDNVDLMKANPDYVKQLDLLPEDKRRAHRYGDWNALAGTFFEEFEDGLHSCKPFPIPQNWARYRAFDYGLDMFYCIWVAVDKRAKSKEKKLPRRVVTVVPVKEYNASEVKKIRNETGMAQKTFASYLGVSCKTVEAWESGINHPSGAASRLLHMMEMDRNLTKEFPFVSIEE